MKKTMKPTNFIKQAGILALAGIICRIIGILYRRPLTQLLGKEGLGYYSMAYNVYMIILLVSSYSIPSAISKEISKKLIIKDFKNAQKIFYCAIIYVVIAGALASIVTYFGAGLLVEQNSAIVLKVFAPTIFLSGILGAFRGYFQAHRTMIQTSISQILEQIFNAVISIVAAYLLIRTVADKDSTTQAVFGATGSAIGTCAGVFIALVFILSIYLYNRKSMLNQIQESVLVKEDTYQDIFKNLFLTVTPIILSTFVYNLCTTLNQTLYTKILINLKNFQENIIAGHYGVFSGEAIVIINIPIALASAISTAMLPSVSGTYALGNVKDTNHKIDVAIRATMLIAIPSAFGLYTLATPIVQTLFPQKDTILQASLLVRLLSITVLFYSLSTITNGVLQAINKVNLPVINALISLTIQTIVLLTLLLTTDLNLYSLAIATILYSFLMCIMNQVAVQHNLDYKLDYKKIFIIPTICSSIMGAVAFFSYHILFMLCKSNLISLLISITCSLFTYFVMIIKSGSISKKELELLPLGETIIAIASKLHLV
jgi:stage V sporulation protein B